MSTLYEKIGGEPTIEKLITHFYQRVLADPLLQPFFENTSIEKLQRMQAVFFSAALDGPPMTTKLELFESHRGRGIRREHLTQFTDHLVETLREIGIEEQDTQSIYRRIALYANEILGESSVDG
jgi:hemoglobin